MKQPTIEVHYGNVFAKGKTSKVTFAAAPSLTVPLPAHEVLRLQVSAACNGVIMGLKLRGYELALEAAVAALRPEHCDFDYPAASAS